jgi:hypothetical protein
MKAAGRFLRLSDQILVSTNELLSRSFEANQLCRGILVSAVHRQLPALFHHTLKPFVLFFFHLHHFKFASTVLCIHQDLFSYG